MVDLLTRSLIKLCVCFELECIDIADDVTSPENGRIYNCIDADSWLCDRSWYAVKCAKLCGKCSHGNNSIQIWRGQSYTFHNTRVMLSHFYS